MEENMTFRKLNELITLIIYYANTGISLLTEISFKSIDYTYKAFFRYLKNISYHINYIISFRIFIFILIIFRIFRMQV
jgi:hypothetical protein